jgi:chemotaxis protein MotB
VLPAACCLLTLWMTMLRREEAEAEKERAIELLEKKAADVKESRARVAELETKLSAAEGGEELTRTSASLSNMETQYASQKRMNAEKATIISGLERETARLREHLAEAEAKNSNAAESRKQRDSGIEEQAGLVAERLGQAEASLALKEKELAALREAGDAAKASRDAAQGELAKLKAVVDAQAAAAEQRQASALKETEAHSSLLVEVEALRTEVKVKERAINTALLQSAERGSNADAAQVAAETASAELEKMRTVVTEKANAAASAAQGEMLANQGKEEAEKLSAALRVELQTAQASLMELRKDMDARVQNLTTEMSAAQNEGSASAAQMATLQGDLEKARIALNAAAAASLSKDAELAALSKELGAGNVARQQAEAAASKERVSYKASYLLTHVVFLAVCVTDRVYICA